MDSLKGFTIAVLSLAIAGIVCITLQKFFPSISQQKSWRKESLLDFKYWLFSYLINGHLILFSTVILITAFSAFIPNLSARLAATDTPELNLFQVIMALLMLDFVGYWIHRVFHTSKLWDFHSIHHSSKEIDWISSVRFHPLESAVIIALIYSSCIIFGLGFKEVGIALLIRSFYGFLVHANLSWNFGLFGYVFASPHFHRWHHAKDKEAIDKNFAGMFSFWDFIFGTAYFPRHKQATNLGIHNDIGDNFLQHLVHPFRKKKAKPHIVKA